MALRRVDQQHGLPKRRGAANWVLGRPTRPRQFQGDEWRLRAVVADHERPAPEDQPIHRLALPCASVGGSPARLRIVSATRLANARFFSGVHSP